MKAYEIQKTFGMDSLTRTERAEPEPQPYEVLIRLRAASLNFRDLLMLQGLYNPKQRLPLIPLSDGVGEVVSVGKEVTRVKVGERVAGIFAQKWISGAPTREKLTSTLGGPYDGMLAEYIALNEEGVVRVPDHLTDEEAATLPCAAVTAWNALISQGDLKAGDTVLIQGTGGVSLFALQFARMVGARVIATSSRDEKLARLAVLGVADGINYQTTPEWDKRVRELTGGAGVDHIVEVGGAGTLARSVRAISLGGKISVIGVLSGVTSEFNIIPLLMQSVRLQGILVGDRETFEAMNRAIALHRMRPVVDRVFPFAEARAAFDYLASGAHFGKICLRF
ncbi:MAG: NAD(P)-dependent alcohol dehydrogenase [Acidobacteria bacterium]|nr:NAD(P)-dependent alcohol dehydrogenase [Acidobacteriota bacterium]MBI3656615.1 NAD(P)-dependent alcohol dehydrogenase [Acidobacteriota bacterium]